jgi:hypothetical protein
MRAEKYVLLDVPFWVVTARYPSRALARAAWERVERLDRSGRLELGVYRHGSITGGNPGCDVTIVSHLPDGMEAAERELFNGPTTAELVRLELDFVQAMIVRRVRVMAMTEALPGEVGQLVIRRGTRGAFLRPDGTMDERIGGDE